MYPMESEKITGFPTTQGLYDSNFEHDACGIGFVVNIKGKKSHKIVTQALKILVNLAHRGGKGSEANTGDGAGILLQIPHEFFKTACKANGILIPDQKEYGVGMVFLPCDAAKRKLCEKKIEFLVKEEGQTLLGWRTVPVKSDSLGNMAKANMPFIRQIFIKKSKELKDDKDELAFERKLYLIRKRAEKLTEHVAENSDKYFYFASLSSRTIVYKGMLTADQVDEYYVELTDPLVVSALALVHSRYSTNTFPSWERAHPYRYIIHNGEINTLRGNVNWMNARQSAFTSKLFGEDVKKIFPIINPDGSDSAMFDNTLEFLMLSGYSLAHAMMMMIPEPWNNHESMSDEKKAFYEYHSCMMEPWDGPAAMAFTDGSIVGAVLDRNGLRPSRYYVTKDDLVIAASEVGVLDIPPEDILVKDRLRAGRMLLIDTKEGRIITDEELKTGMSAEHPYRKWINDNMIELEQLPKPSFVYGTDFGTILQREKVFGFTYEDIKAVLLPMARDGAESIGSMGTDTPLAVLSNIPQLLYNYFKQLFAQVTNPPIDSIREEIVTSTITLLGAEGNLLKLKPSNCHQLKLKTPILDNAELAKLRNIDEKGFKSATIPILYKVEEGEAGLEAALQHIFRVADQQIQEGVNIIILSDRDVTKTNAPIPALLAVSGLHQHLIKKETRTQVSLIVESGEPRETHHFALLLGYGASAINPYLTFEIIDYMIQQEIIANTDASHAVKKYIKASVKGIVKILSKMGICTVQSYQGAQIFEAVGISKNIIDQYFTLTPSLIGGIGLDVIASEAQSRHTNAYFGSPIDHNILEPGGQYQWRYDGEYHMYNPETIQKLQTSCRTGNYTLFKEYTELLDHQTEQFHTLRGLMEFDFSEESIPLEEVESIEEICKRFKTGAMSYGSISQEAHEALAIAMNRIGGRSNTGEGGEDPNRFIVQENGDSRCSAIKQVASGRFGVTSEYLVNAKELQIKMAQGAKPGEGGQLPGKKVYPWIAKVRHSTPGVELISPPPHHDIYSIEDLAELIHDLKNANAQARISVKLVSEIGVGTIAAGVAKGRADVIVISGYDGGTGASPRTSIRHTGLPWELGLAETHQTLLLNNLRSRIVVETDGKLMTGRDVVIATLLGAEEYGFATAALVTLGCVMMRVCNLDTCPVGIATQNPELRKNFTGDPVYVVNLMHFMAQEMREWMAKLGFRTINEMVGRSDRLKTNQAIHHWKAKGIDLSSILYQPKVSASVGRYCQMQQDHELDQALDRRVLMKLCQPALDCGTKIKATLPIRNINRVVGTILGSEVTRRFGSQGLPEDTIWLHFQGSAGQSFGAFVPRGITLELEGDANDYVGKGLSGGRMMVYPDKKSTFIAENNIVIGNVAFYGATSGEAYVRGIAGERFCVRNSGVNAVVEGVGDHGCEYMTGGRVVVLGSTGRNFAAGMSGGIAYVLDVDGTFRLKCNKGMVDLEEMTREDALLVKKMIEKHVLYTGSTYANDIIKSWSKTSKNFVKVMPKDYKKMLTAIKKAHDRGLKGEKALLVAFESRNK